MRKCSALSVAQKVSILEAVKNRGAKTKEQIAKEFGIPPSTLSTILKNEDVFSALVTLENEVDRHRLQHLQQSRITQFFKI